MAHGWRKALAAAGVPHVEPYALRHSSIVRGLRSGVPVRIVAALHDTSTVDDRSSITARTSWIWPTNWRAARSCPWCLSRLRRCRLSRDAGSEAGPQALAVADGIARAVRTRSGVEFYAEGWPEGIGPTGGVANAINGTKPDDLRGHCVRAEPSKKRRRSLRTARISSPRRMLNGLR